MMKKRSTVYRVFPEYRQGRDNRTMDEICDSNGEFSLQVQQKFLIDYMRKNPSWNRLVLYHALGSGKTCSSISMAEEYLRQNPSNKVTVILPARLRTNFFDELISPCGMEAYISKEEFYTYYDSNTSSSLKKKIRKKFMDNINARYEIMSFEKFKNLTKSFPTLKEWANYLTRDRMIVIDEVHNLLNNVYKVEHLKSTFETHEIPHKSKGTYTLLLRYLSKNAHESCKMVFMTATPIFDNSGQMKELVGAVNPTVDTQKAMKLSKAIEQLRGLVSFYPGISAKAYPSSSFETHEIPLSNLQDELTHIEIEKKRDFFNPDKESFLARQRQISIACLPNNENITKNIKKVISDMDEYAPKVKELLKQLDKPGKHVVFSNFIQSGLNIVKEALK